MSPFFFFFFQAEDGIRDYKVTGVQTCALPILHTDPWRVMRITAEFVEGFGLLAELGPAVSVFGSARVPPGSVDYERAERIGAELARAGYAVITGGGPGVREAANKGAMSAN